MNQFIDFLNDFRNFADLNGLVNLGGKIQAYGAAQLLFADILGVSGSTSAHNRISFGMSALDKLANLRKHVGGINKPEAELMVNFLYDEQKDQLKTLVHNSFARFNYSELSQSFVDVIDKCYSGLHDHLASNSPSCVNSEAERLAVVRSQRNLRHGTYLFGSAFNNLFSQGPGTLPSVFGAIPFLLTLGLVANTEDFLSFDPTPSS